MNPVDPRERPATAFCQNCGKPLYPETARSADGLVLCEPCLLERYPGGAPAPAAGAAAPPYTAVPYAAVPGIPAGVSPSANPVLAGLLGLIPGVGAMYNGQFIKALVHVVIFVVLIGITENYDYVGYLIAVWVLYQVFDAAQTAAARRDGTPLPDPFGILEWSRRIGPPAAAQPPAAPFSMGAAPGGAAGAVSGAPGFSAAPPPAGYGSAPYGPAPAAPAGYAPVAAAVAPAEASAFRRSEPTGAIVLIAVGLLFLLSNFGILRASVVARSWPILLLGLGAWLLVRRVRALPQALPAHPAGGSPAGFSAPAAPAPREPERKEDQL